MTPPFAIKPSSTKPRMIIGVSGDFILGDFISFHVNIL